MWTPKLSRNFIAAITWLVAPLTFLALAMNVIALVQPAFVRGSIFGELLLSKELLSALLGSIAGSLGAYRVALGFRKLDGRDRQKGLLLGLLYKCHAMASHARAIRMSLDNMQPKGGRVLHQMVGSIPTDMWISGEELAEASSLLDVGLMNSLLCLDDKHNSLMARARLYNENIRAFLEFLAAVEVNSKGVDADVLREAIDRRTEALNKTWTDLLAQASYCETVLLRAMTLTQVHVTRLFDIPYELAYGPEVQNPAGRDGAASSEAA